MSVLESAVVVAVPEAEFAVASWRNRLDPAAGRGVPAHITLLYPFLPPAEIDDAVLEALSAVIAAVPAFDCILARVSWFGAAVVWLDPDPSEPFRELTAGVWRTFPRCPPYGGLHEEPIPHLTVGDDGPPADMLAAERSVQALLPIRTRVTMARLICGSMAANSWHTVRELPLGPAHA